MKPGNFPFRLLAIVVMLLFESVELVGRRLQRRNPLLQTADMVFNVAQPSLLVVKPALGFAAHVVQAADVRFDFVQFFVEFIIFRPGGRARLNLNSALCRSASRPAHRHQNDQQRTHRAQQDPDEGKQ